VAAARDAHGAGTARLALSRTKERKRHLRPNLTTAGGLTLHGALRLSVVISSPLLSNLSGAGSLNGGSLLALFQHAVGRRGLPRNSSLPSC